MGTAAAAMKGALLTACQGIYPAPVKVCYGHPGTNLPDDIVSIGNITSDSVVGPLGTARTREESLSIEVTFSCFRGGSDQQVVTERAYELLAMLEAYLTDAGTSSSLQLSLAGTVRRAWVTGHILAETEADLLSQGRVAEITAVVAADVRIS